MNVKAWTEVVTIPTYGIGQPEKNPVFPEKRVYQDSGGVVYPHPVIKSALLGLTGPWISGGIDFNWSQHHRPSTLEPTDYYA